LALSHHVIVQMAAARDGYDSYALLGDDVVVSSDIGTRYSGILNTLGVEISPGKSIQDSSYIEFAKRLINVETGDDYSVLGPGLILNCIRNKAFRVLLLREAFQRGLLTEADARSKVREIEQRDKGSRAISRYGM
jgi:hypothetical protein